MSSLSKIIYTSTNHVNFLSFDNDDMKPSKRQVTFLSLIWGLNHNINKQNLTKFGFALSLQKPIKGPLHRRGRLWSQPNSFTELSLKLSNYSNNPRIRTWIFRFSLNRFLYKWYLKEI